MLQQKSTAHAIFGGVLLFVGLLGAIAFVLVRSQATSVLVEIGNTPPTVSLVKVCETPSNSSCTHVNPITPSVGVPKNHDIYAQIVDANGTDDIDFFQTKAFVYRSGIGASACDQIGEADVNNCRVVIAGCSQDSVVNATTQVMKCGPFPMGHWADPTTPGSDDYASDDWTIRVVVMDSAGGSGTATNTTEVAEVTAISSPDTIDYGSGGQARYLGYASDVTGTVDFFFVNLGNTDADAQIKSDQAAMTCSTGSIPAANQKFKRGTDANYASLAQALTTSFVDMNLEDVLDNGALQRRNSETTAVGEYVHFGIEIPMNSVSGTCTGTTTISAVKQSIAGSGQ